MSLITYSSSKTPKLTLRRQEGSSTELLQLLQRLLAGPIVGVTANLAQPRAVAE